MCLITYHEKPMVAQRDIKVYKHVITIVSDKAQSPYQRTWFDLNKEFFAKPSETYLHPHYDSEKFEICEGAIHACLWPDFGLGRCLEAYIPKGTEYWYGVDKSTVCAKKIFVTNKEVKPEDCAGMDEEMASTVFSESPKNNKGITIGSFFILNSFVSPFIAANSKEDIQGIVVGFNDNEPIVADIQHVIDIVSIDNRYDSELHKFIPNLQASIQDMNGYNHTKIWKNICKDNPNRYESVNVINKFSKNHYIPALGEMELVWKNLTYIAAACSLAHITCPFTLNKFYWTSTEFYNNRNWTNCLCNSGVLRHPHFKSNHFSLVPFVHQKTSIFSTLLQLLKKSYK